MKLLGEFINKYVSKNIVVKRQNGQSHLKSTLRCVYGQKRLATSDWFPMPPHISDSKVRCDTFYPLMQCITKESEMYI